MKKRDAKIIALEIAQGEIGYFIDVYGAGNCYQPDEADKINIELASSGW